MRKNSSFWYSLLFRFITFVGWVFFRLLLILVCVISSSVHICSYYTCHCGWQWWSKGRRRTNTTCL